MNSCGLGEAETEDGMGGGQGGVLPGETFCG